MVRTGIYVRGISESIHKSPEAAARKAALYGVSFVPIMIYWQEQDKDKRINSKVLRDYAQAFTDNGIDVWVWGYPWCGKEEAFIDRFEWARDTCKGLIKGYLIDPELGYQGHRVGKLNAVRGAEILINGLLNIMDESIDFGMTSFGAGHVHKTFPWKQFNCGFGSPQFYKADHDTIRKGLKHWRSTGFDTLYPSIPAYGKNSGDNLQPYIAKIMALAKLQEISVPGVIAWSWRQMGVAEWLILRELALSTSY